MKLKKVLLGVIIAVIIIVAIVAYVGLRTPSEAEERKTVLIVGSTYDPVTLDPAMAYDIASAMIIQNLFDTLVTYKPGTTELVGELAEKWESNPEATEWTFYLRKGVKLHDGTELTAEVVKYSIERAKKLQGPPSFLLDPIKEVQVVDKYTVKFVLEYPFAPFPSLMAFMITAPVSPKAAEELGDAFAEKPVGAGPFKLESWVKGQEVVLVANEDYWQGKPKVSKIIIKIIKDPSSLRIALENGEVDMAFGIQPSDIPALMDNPNIKVVSIEGLVMEWLGMNVEREGLNNKLVRQAISYAINYDYILENVLKGTAIRSYGPLPPKVWGYDENIEEYAYKYDPEKAKQLLAQAGYPNGEGLPEFELIISTEERSERGEVAAVIQDNLRQIGIKVKITNLDWSTYLDRLFNRDFDMHMVDWFPDYVDPDDWFYPLFYSENSLEGFKNETIDQLILKARSISDQTEREAIYKQLQKMIVEEAPWVFLYVPKLYVFMQKNVEGFVLYPAYFIDFYPVSKK